MLRKTFTILMTLFAFTGCVKQAVDGFAADTQKVGRILTVSDPCHPPPGITKPDICNGVGPAHGQTLSTAVQEMVKWRRPVIDKIRAQGVQVILIGDNVMFLLPSDRFFYPNSPNHIRASYPVLDNIARLIRSYDKITVRVSGFTDTRCSQRRAKSLTNQQAHYVADYLWDKGIDTRMIYSEGFGSAKPIANNKTQMGRQQNRRIQISLRLQPPCCIL